MISVEPFTSAASSRAGRISVNDIAVSRAPDRGDFAATLLTMAGHDLRQPLQLITSAHDILATTVRAKEEREQLVRASEAVEQLASMLNQLIKALQLHVRHHEELNVPTSLDPVVSNIRREFTEPARRKGIALHVASDAASTICSEPVLLTSILRNLVRNAIDYTPPGGLVTVTSHQRGSELSIEVCDTGTGIRASVLPRVFNAFQRGDQDQASGLGLGLFIVKRAADLLGHRIDVHSVEGVGSRFTVVTRVPEYRASQRSGPKAECRRRRPPNSTKTPALFTSPVPDAGSEVVLCASAEELEARIRIG